MARKRIAVIFGGCSTEYGVSLQSAYGVLSHLNAEKYEAIPLGITREGKWYYYNGPAEEIREDRWFGRRCLPACISPDRGQPRILAFRDNGVEIRAFDIAFPVLHGKNGEDGTLQGLLELAGIPYVGCGVLSSAIGMDKVLAHQLAAAAGVKVPASVSFDTPKSQEELEQLTKELKLPLFVKPANAGSSYGITMLEDRSGLAEAVARAFCHDAKVLIEEAVAGFEVGCAVLGNHELVLGEVDEIELKGGWFDYEEKYHRRTAEIHMPARLDTVSREKIRREAAKIYRALGCRGFARVDLFWTPAGEVVFNEINTIPGLTACSRFPSMLQGSGLGFREILEKLICLAEEQAAEKEGEKAVRGR
ncbi:MAG: D-alanine--D-serine ligase VanG [Peptococcaceae bacterium]|nr:D-alanine--D-serine ligase VanG [Peptococcaceae bacterium]